jgi:predicted RNase H-like nuclease (RuvC/YqgF family)
VDTTDVGLLKEQLANLLTRYTDQHPDVRNLKSKIARLEAEIANVKGGSSTINRSGFITSRSRYAQKLERQRTGLLSEKMAVEVDIAKLKRDIVNYQDRVEKTPKREQEFVTLQRDYDNLNASYKSLLNRKLEAEMAVSMERKLKGEKFQILESARLPKNPVEPNLKLMIIVSIALGVGIGSGLVLLLENMHNTYSGPDEIETELELPVIATIPQVLTKRDIFMKRAEVTLCSLVIIMTVIAIGAFTFISITGMDLAIEAVRQYMNA